ncbi:TetR/AcrR family transcriptional regulator [Acidisoma cellulosilytica]|uniref:TetR/AcrR family transcriptional regulator n=1 Tax=Acidisoma cellulosilyticum TaxID=2802395 RepID=A0A963Z6F8_9PROT|nr:TetR/AcrR family transcriptional regulator [Acidisoma cellulosilyticum]MCB8883702.1 TetR/AcrR family transcriptional regulator [Acidisoma cellulosilyticum]
MKEVRLAEAIEGTSGAVLTAPRASRKARETREKLIEGALLALCEDGVTGITTRKIAERAGVQLGTLHYHFENKDMLLLAVLDMLGARLARTLRLGVAGSRNLDECIQRALLTDWNATEENFAIQLVQYELTLYALRTKGAAWMAQRQYNDYIKAHNDVFAPHAPGNDQTTAENVQRLSQLVMAGIDGIILQELAAPDLARSRSAVRALISAMQALARSLGLIPA